MAISNSRIHQAKNALRTYILAHNLVSGDRLLSESEMAKVMGVSRNTLREAYISFENEGFIVRRHGIGTFIAKPPIIKDSLNAFLSFAQIIENAGYTPSFKTLMMDDVPAPQSVCDTFQISNQQKIFYIERVVFADDKPTIYINDYFAPYVQQCNPNWDVFAGNLVQFLANTLDTKLHQLQSHIRAVALSEKIADVLQLSKNSPALSVKSLIFTIDNQPVTHSCIWFNSNIVELDIVRIIHGGK